MITTFGYGLDQKIAGKDMNAYLASLAEANEKQSIEIERGKLAISIANAMTKHSRACLDAMALEAKLARKDAELANYKAEIAEMRFRKAKSN